LMCCSTIEIVDQAIKLEKPFAAENHWGFNR
jgi:hypothetical protein